MATPVKGMSARAAQAERTRQQILETAQRLFTEHGYEATPLRMNVEETGPSKGARDHQTLVAHELGLTTRAVYYHFRAKTDILHAAMQPGIQRLKALLDETATLRG